MKNLSAAALSQEQRVVRVGFILGVVFLILFALASPLLAQVQILAGDETTLGAAITTANGALGTDYEILLTADIVLNAALPDVTSTILIRPNGVAPTGNRIERSLAAAAFRLFKVRSVSGSAGELTVEDVTLANGRATGSPAKGGAIEVADSSVSVPKARLTLTRATLIDNRAEGSSSGGQAQGGAIWAGGDTFLTIVDSVLETNVAIGGSPSFGNAGDGHGGAIYITRTGLGQTAVTNITGTTFRQNEVRGGNAPSSLGGFARGGALRSLESKIGLNGGNVFIENVAVGGFGGGSFARPGEGGALFIADPEASASQAINGDAFIGNRAEGASGAMGLGGAILIGFNGPISFTDVEVRANLAVGGGSAVGRGGGILLTGTPIVTSTRLVLLDNIADEGGGLYFGPATASFTDSCVVNNSDLAYETSGGSQIADSIWWGHPTGPGPPGGSGLGDTVSSAVTVNSWLSQPPTGLDCSASVPFDCSTVSISPGAGANEKDLVFTTSEVGFTGLEFLSGIDVSNGGFTPPGCESSGSNQVCTGLITLTVPGGGTASATYIVRTPGSGPTLCTYTGAEGLPVTLLGLSLE